MSTLQESPHSETLTVDGEITHAKSWLAPVMAILALILGLVVGGVLGRSSVDEAGSQPTAAVEQVIADLNAAVNAGDAATIASFYAEDAVMEELTTDPSKVTEGAAAIGEHMKGYVDMGFAIHPTGDLMQYGNFVAETSGWAGGGGVVVYELDANLKVMHQWVIGTA